MVFKDLDTDLSSGNKVVYTIYNKNNNLIDGVIMEVEPKDGYHFVEMVYDEEVKSTLTPAETKQALKLQIKADDVVCIAQLPKSIQTKQQNNQIIISLKSNVEGTRLVA